MIQRLLLIILFCITQVHSYSQKKMRVPWFYFMQMGTHNNDGTATLDSIANSVEAMIVISDTSHQIVLQITEPHTDKPARLERYYWKSKKIGNQSCKNCVLFVLDPKNSAEWDSLYFFIEDNGVCQGYEFYNKKKMLVFK